MKKVMYLLFGLILTFTACNNDLDNAPQEDGMSRISIGISQGAQTRSAESSSQASVIEGVHARYILEIYHVNSNTPEGGLGELYLRKEQIATSDVENPHIFDFRLISKQKYNFLIWVDYVANSSDDLHYDTSNGLNNIVLKNSVYKNFDHSRDAFFTSFTKENVTGTFTEVPECKRPFGQMNIKTSDWEWVADQKLVNPHITPKTIEFSFNAPKSFNVFTKTTGTVDENTPFSYVIDVPATGILEDLTCDYIFAPLSGQLLVNPTMVFKNKANEEITNATDLLKNTPIQRNYQTYVIGNLLTKVGELKVMVDPVWDNSNEELVRPEEQASTFHILPNDPNLKMINGVYSYTIPTSIISETDDAINLIFDEMTVSADFSPRAITIIAPANLLQTIATINVEANLVKYPLSFTVDAPKFAGSVNFANINHSEYPSGDVEYNFNDLTLNMPNGSAVIGDNVKVKGDVTFVVKNTTFTVNESAIIAGNVVANAGRANIYGKVMKNATMNNSAWLNLYGTVDGTIYVNDDAKADVWRNGQAKHFYTSSISSCKYSQWKGFGVSVGDAIDLVLPDFALPEFLDLGVRINFSGAYANFDFGDHATGFNWKTFRNLRYDFYNNAATPAVVATSTLKNDIQANLITIGEILDIINKPANDLKKELAEKVVKIDELIAKYNTSLPPVLKDKLIPELEKLKNILNYYINGIPTVEHPAGIPTLPFATFIPASDNFELATIIKLIGKPGDKFNIMDIPGYIDGSKNLSLYMVINLLSDYQASSENLVALKAEKSALETEKAGLNAEKNQILEEKGKLKERPEYKALYTEFEKAVINYDNSPEPAPLLGSWGSYSIAKAGKNLLFPTAGGSYFSYKWTILWGESRVPKTSKARIAEKNRLIDIVEAKVDASEAWLANAAGPLETRLLAINARINAINTRINGTIEQGLLDGLNAQIRAAEYGTGLLEGAFEQLGIPKETIQTISEVLNAITPYLETTTDILNTVNNTIIKIQGYNPFKYDKKASSTTIFSKLGIDAKFEYEADKLIYVRCNK